MQHATTSPYAHTARAVLRRSAWLGLGLFCVAFAVFEVAKHGQGALALALARG